MSEQRLNPNKLPYGNYSIYHPNGDVMFYCSKKRYMWYVSRNLAVEFEDRKAKLVFEPNGPGENPQFLKPRENICINCGIKENLTMHHIVPRMFRVHIPDEYRIHNSLDVVVLCRECHNTYERKADGLKNKLCPISEENLLERHRQNAIKLSQTLSLHGDKIPESRKRELVSKLTDMLNQLGMTEEMLRLDTGKDNMPARKAKKVVEEIGVVELIRMWKEHFYSNMELKFLPEWWDGDFIKVLKEY